MNIQEILIENNYIEEAGKMNDEILKMDIGTCTNIRPIPNDMCKLFEGVELTNKSETCVITLNFEFFNGEDEFLPLAVNWIGEDGFISVAKNYDEKLNLVYEENL